MANKVKLFTTDDYPLGRRPDAWRAQMKGLYSELGLAIEDLGQFRVKFCRVRLGQLGISWFAATGSSAEVKRSSVGRLADQISDAFLLVMQLSGEIAGQQDGKYVHAGPGDMTLIDATRPWEFVASGACSSITVKLPSEKLLGIVEQPERFCFQRFSSDAPAVVAVRSVLQGLVQAIEAAPDEAWDAGYEDLVLAAVARLFPRGDPASNTTVKQESLRRKLIAFIERRLDDPMLGAAAMAAEFGISVRTVQRLFKDEARTPGEYILERRLLRASEHLRLNHDDRISDIAFAVGFNDLSYFTRKFTGRFGYSPSRYRKLRLSAPATPALGVPA